MEEIDDRCLGSQALFTEHLLLLLLESKHRARRQLASLSRVFFCILTQFYLSFHFKAPNVPCFLTHLKMLIKSWPELSLHPALRSIQ